MPDRSERLVVYVPVTLAERLDAFRARYHLSRSTAALVLLERALAAGEEDGSVPS